MLWRWRFGSDDLGKARSMYEREPAAEKAREKDG
jgi:hypothetical protein